MITLFLTAVDVWLFRDGRPFDPGSGRRADSMFPPYPTVIQGAIRSHHLVVKGVGLNTQALNNKQKIIDTVGTASDYKNLRLRGPFIARLANGTITRYYPQPADAVTVSHLDHTLKAASPPVIAPEGLKTSVGASIELLGLDAPLEKGESHLWLEENELLNYLDGKVARCCPQNVLFQHENHIGIGMNSYKQTVQEGMLYEVGFIRPMPDVGLWIEMNGYDGWPTQGLLQLGGESRAAAFTSQVKFNPYPTFPDPLPQRFKVYFATPTFFEGGWQPRDWAKYFTTPVTLKAAAIGRYNIVGGFDWASQFHKPSRRYVPAGSVYYFSCPPGTQLKSTLIQNSITDFGAEIGFGQTIIKEW